MFVFPAFNENFKTRKRTFRCCKNCRVKRVRCIILDSTYDVEGCDNCKAQGIPCDLVGNMKLKEKKVTKPRSKARKEKLPDAHTVQTPDQQSPAATATNSVIPSPSIDVTNQQDPIQYYRNDNSLENSALNLQANVAFSAPHDTLSSMTPANAGVQLPRIDVPQNRYNDQGGFGNIDSLANGQLPMRAISSAQSNTRNILPALNGLFPTSYNSPLNKPLPSFQQPHNFRSFFPPLTINSPRKNSLGGATPLPPLHDPSRPPSSGTDNIDRRNSGCSSFSSDPIARQKLDFQGQSIDEKYQNLASNIDQTIQLIDHRFLKREFNFNCTFRESHYQIGKQFTAKQITESSSEQRKRESASNGKTLNKTHILQFKILLSLHAFSLDTPGFYSIQLEDLIKLFEIYFYKFNSVFPIVFEAEFWELHKRGKIPNIIIYGVILVAANDDLAEPILRKSFLASESSFDENRSRFLKELESKIRHLLDFLPEFGDTEKLARLITLLLLSLNYRFNKFGNEQSSIDLCTGIGYAYSLLFHHESFHEMLCKMGASKKSRYLRHLWWLIFSLDRFNGILNGKAVFIHRLDFNVNLVTDSPHLQRIVALAYALEDTVVAGFRPPKKGKQLPEKETADGDPEFDPDQIIGNELKVLEDTENTNRILGINGQVLFDGHLPAIKLEVYQDRSVFLLERFMYHQIILLLRTGTLKTLRDSNQLDFFSLQLSRSLLQIFQMAKGGQNHKLLVSTPLIPLILLISFSVPSVARFHLLHSENSASPRQVMDLVKNISDAILSELRSYTRKWWFVSEVVDSLDRIHSDGSERVRLRNKPDLEYFTPKEHMISIKTLSSDASDAECVLPALKAISSPGFYDDVVLSEEKAEEELAIIEGDGNDLRGNVNTGTQPGTWSGSPEKVVNAGLLWENSGNPEENIPGDSNSERLSFADDLFFDVARMADTVSLSNFMDFFPDSQFNPF